MYLWSFIHELVMCNLLMDPYGCLTPPFMLQIGITPRPLPTALKQYNKTYMWLHTTAIGALPTSRQRASAMH